MADKKDLTGIFDKCAAYSVMSILIANTINSMKRFRTVPGDEMITKVYSTVKSKAASLQK